MTDPDFTAVTEQPGIPSTADQRTRLYHRYRFAADLSGGKRVLEVACGAGLGLGFLATSARSLVGGDHSEPLLRTARDLVEGVPLLRLDAHKLPFCDDSFDVVVMFEAIYYLRRPEDFVSECRRVLTSDGLLLIGTVNPEWSGFVPSLFSQHHHSIPELHELLVESGFSEVSFHGAFPVSTRSGRDIVVGTIRAVVAKLGLAPKTLAGRRFLKRIFYGALSPLEPVGDGMSEYDPPVPMDPSGPRDGYKIVYTTTRAE